MENQEVEVVSLLKSPKLACKEDDQEENVAGKEMAETETQLLSQTNETKHGHEVNDKGMKQYFGIRGKACVWLLIMVFLLLAALGLCHINWALMRFVLFLIRQIIDLLLWSHFHPLPKGTQPKNFTFPSVEERVHYYMSNWYDIPQDYITGLNKSSSVCTDITFCKPGFVCKHGVLWIQSEESIPHHLRGGSYEGDTLSLFKLLEPEQRKRNPRIVIVYGDKKIQNPEHPVFAKARYTEDDQPIQPVTSQAIITYLNSARHYGLVRGAVNYFAWHEKKGTLIFRGVNTGKGKRASTVQKYNQIGEYSIQDIDLALTSSDRQKSTKEFSYDRTKYRPLFRDWKTQYQVLQYKYILVMEGNDVSSGLKWMLFSNSVVFMAKPTRVSWAMEDLLMPFVHYVPVKDDYSDLLEKVEWARAHDEECQLISQHATQYIYDLHVSRQAKEDREEILRQMVQRYYTNYSTILAEC